MATTIPCPNPVCTHDFSPAELQAATSLQCPKCGFRMQGRAAAPKPTPAGKPIAPKPVAPAAKPPMAKPIAPSAVSAGKVVLATPVQTPAKPAPKPPMAAPVVATPVAPAKPPVASPVASVSGEESIPDGSFFNPDLASAAGPLVQGTRKPKKPINWAKLAVNVLVVGFASSVVIIVIVLLISFYLDTSGQGVRSDGASHTGYILNSQGTDEKVYELSLPKGEWSFEREIKSKLGAHVAWKHTQHDFWFAVVVKDYVNFKPRDAEMLRFGIEKLESQFADNIELAAKAEPAKIGELAAQKLQFKGQVKAANWLGECYMFFNNGIGYWLFVASPDWDTVQHFASELPARHFTVVSDRKNWQEKPLPLETYPSTDGKFTVTAPKGVWERTENPKNVEDRAELLLVGRYLKERDNRKNALMMMFTIEKKTDLKEAIKAARDYLDKRTKDDNANNKIAHAADVAEGQTEIGAEQDIGNRRGRLIDLKLQVMDEPKRYYLMAVVNEPDICYVILCDTTWESRQIWRGEFIDLLRSVRLPKSAD